MAAENVGSGRADARKALERFYELVEAGQEISFENYCAGMPGLEAEVRRLEEERRTISKVLER